MFGTIGALDTTSDTYNMRQRALKSLRRRNDLRKQEYETQGGIWMPYMAEQEDPNRVWTTVLQGLEESARGDRTRIRFPRPTRGF